MANLSIASACNRRCDYCFARGALEVHTAGSTAMPLQLVERGLDFLVRSGMPEVRLLGGEPTLHPQFLEIVDLALDRGLTVSVFTGGMISERVLGRLRRIDPERIMLLVNFVDPVDAQDPVVRRQHAVLDALGPRASLGVNVSSPGTALAPALSAIDRYGLSKQIRLGIAHPAVGADNRHLHPRHYPTAGKRVWEFARLARTRQVRIDWDCGWVPCMFPVDGPRSEGLLPDDLGLRCNPIPDVLPDGRIIACYATADLASEPLRPGDNAAAARNRLAVQLAPYRGFLLFKECRDCRFRAIGKCVGGCVSAALRRVHTRSASMTRRQVDPDSSPSPTPIVLGASGTGTE